MIKKKKGKKSRQEYESRKLMKCFVDVNLVTKFDLQELDWSQAKDFGKAIPTFRSYWKGYPSGYSSGAPGRKPGSGDVEEREEEPWIDGTDVGVGDRAPAAVVGVK